MVGKRAFLQQLTSRLRLRSVALSSTRFEGSSPPSVFIGRHNYPAVYAGPMLAQEPDSFVYDCPERWLGCFDKSQIIGFRLGLLRGKRRIRVTDVESQFAQKLREIALSGSSLAVRAEFSRIPRGLSLSEEHQPFGPSAPLTSLETENARWQADLEKAHYDTELTAADAVVELDQKGLEFSAIQKALSVGAFGRLRRRRLVPTRWSITATDDILARHALTEVRQSELIDEFRVYERGGLQNRFVVLLTPTPWRYEAVEAFINVLGRRTFFFSDFEGLAGRKHYSEMGGCYYAQRAAVADFLRQRDEQAGAFVFREIYEGYTPMGVWLCRELTRAALATEPKVFETLGEALRHIDSRLALGVAAHRQNMPLLRDQGKQSSLLDFA